MKRFYSILVFVLILPAGLFSQTGTIRIAKPKPVAKDTVITRKVPLGISVHVSSNYTFKNNKKIGYEGGIAFVNGYPGPHAYSIGLSYCVEEQYYQLSSYNRDLLQANIPFSKSQNHSEYLKLNLKMGTALSFMASRAGGSAYFDLGLSPEYLLKTRDEHQRLNYADFRQYNLAGSITLGIPFKKSNFTVTYSKDFFENLKDQKLYDSYGAVSGKQKSKTRLLSFSFCYYFGLR